VCITFTSLALDLTCPASDIPVEPDDPCVDGDAEPESKCPFSWTHELGHIFMYRWLCLQGNDSPNGATGCDTNGHGWENDDDNIERCSTTEGWADFVAVAGAWRRDIVPDEDPPGPGETGAGSALYCGPEGLLVSRQVELISPDGNDVTKSASNRDCECGEPDDGPANLNSGLGNPSCDAVAAVVFWDAYDTYADNPTADGADDYSAGSFQAMLDGWWNYCDGILNRCDQEGQIPGCESACSAVRSAENLYDYSWNITGTLSNVILQACAGAQCAGYCGPTAGELCAEPTHQPPHNCIARGCL